MLNYEEIIKRFEKAKANKLLWEYLIRECYKYALPEKNTIDTFSKGSNKRFRLHDDTAVDSLEDFSNKMTANLVPSNSKWIKLSAGTDIPKEAEEKVDEQLEEISDILFEHINSSNFTSQITEAFLDLGISTGAIICEAGDGIQSSLNFRAISLSELYLERSSKGMIDTVFRLFKVEAQDILKTWKNATLTEDLIRISKEKPSTEIELIEGVIENQGIYTSVLMYPAEKSFLVNRKLKYNPYIVFRESTIAGEVYGRGRVMKQIDNIKTLNQMRENELKAIAWVGSPPWGIVSDGVINPHTTVVAPDHNIIMEQKDSVYPIQAGGNIGVLKDSIRDYQSQIRRALLSKPFGNIEETPVRTATEMSIRNAENSATTLAATSRIQNELLQRLISNSIEILKQAGKVPDIKVDGKEVKIKFVNPSTKQQDENQLASYGRFMEMMAVLPPEVVSQKFKIEDLPQEISKTLGLPSRMIRSDEEIESIKQQQQEMLQQQMEQQGLPNEQ